MGVVVVVVCSLQDGRGVSDDHGLIVVVVWRSGGW